VLVLVLVLVLVPEQNWPDNKPFWFREWGRQMSRCRIGPAQSMCEP
jgi:hypothetical protein